VAINQYFAAAEEDSYFEILYLMVCLVIHFYTGFDRNISGPWSSGTMVGMQHLLNAGEHMIDLHTV